MAYRTVDFRQQSKSSPAQVVTGAIADQTVYFRITTASPLHIGCDEVYEPTSFVIDTKAKELVSFKTASFLEQFDSDALGKFSTICKKGTVVSLLELFKFMRSQADLAEGQRIRVPEAFIQHYESTLGLAQNERTVGQELNSFQIMRTAFDIMTGNAYLPGSAIKGAIRTAVLNLRNNEKSTPQFRGRNAGRELQEQLLNFRFNHLESDPFRLLKVSDFFPINDAARAITYAVDQKKKPSDKEAQAPYQILETVEPGAEFIGIITVLASLGKDAEIQQSLTLDEITRALTSFYGAEKQREDREVKDISVLPADLVVDEKSLPLRIGRHSGAECVTVKGHRNIKIMQGKGNPEKYLDHATTVWLAAEAKKPTTNQGLKPFGWVRFEQLAFEEGQRLKEAAERKKAAVLEGLRDKIAARKKQEEENREKEAAQQQKAADEAARLAAEAVEKEAEAEQERQALAAMTETERDAYIIRKPETSDETIAGFYKKLPGLPPDDQQLIAQALCDRWKEYEKWDRSQCSSTQWEKVKLVKAILEPAQEASELSPEEQAEVEKVQSLNGWSKDIINLIDTLSLLAIELLRDRMKNEWGCAEKRAKSDKKQAVKALNKRIKELKNA